MGGQALGFAMMALAVLLLPFADIAAKALASRYDAWQIVWLRNVTHAAILLPFLLGRLRQNPPRPRRPWLHLVRVICFTLMTVCYVTALRHMPLVDAQAILFVFPLIVVALSVLLLGETLTPRVLIAASLGFAGVLFVLRPGGVSFSIASLAVLGAACFTSGYMILNRLLAATNSQAFLILSPPAFAAVALAVLQPAIWRTPDLFDWALFVGIGALSAAIHAMILLAHARVEASQLAPLSYLQVVTGAMLGYLVFGDIPSAATLLGMALIILGGTLVRGRAKPGVGAAPRMG